MWYGKAKLEPFLAVFFMSVTIELPEPVARILGPANEIPRRLLESIVADLYREDKISRGEVRQILGLSWHENEAFLARKGCTRHYSVDDLEEDWRNNQQIVAKG